MIQLFAIFVSFLLNECSDGNRTEFRYDGNNRITERIQVFTASGSRVEKTESYTYDPADNLRSVIDRLGRLRQFDYDALNRLVTEQWFESDASTLVKQIDLAYDAVGNLESAGDDAATYAMTYDQRNRLTSVATTYTFEPSNLSTFTLDYSYDDAARTQTTTDSDGVQVVRTRDARGLLKQLVWQGGESPRPA